MLYMPLYTHHRHICRLTRYVICDLWSARSANMIQSYPFFDGILVTSTINKTFYHQEEGAANASKPPYSDIHSSDKPHWFRLEIIGFVINPQVTIP